MRTHLLSTIVLMTILTVACGGRASSPISPSGVAPAVSASGNAVVAGNVRLGATAGVGSASDPMKVQVVGTDIVATVSLAGQFVLNGVPSGQIQLHFFGAGVDATVTIGQIATGETVTISVTVVGTTAVVESEARKAPDQAEEQIEGRIESLPPAQAAGTFVVAGRTVTTTATTVFTMGSVTTTFADLDIGQRAHVKGTTTAGVFTASLVDIQNVQTDLPVNVNGIVSGLTGSELAFQFMVNGRQIAGDHLTVFHGSGGMGRFTSLANGVRVEVKGQQRDSLVYAVRIHVNGEDDGPEEFEAKGALVSLTGSCPAYTFVLAGRTVTTDASTQFKGAACADVFNGLTIEVEGTIQADGTVRARRVTIDGRDLEFEAEGVIAGLTGACPSLVFTIGGRTVTTGAATQFKSAGCDGVMNGVTAEVAGVIQPDGTVRATRVDVDKAQVEFEASGAVTGLAGTCPSLVFTIGSRTVKTDASTQFKGGACSEVANGDQVEVKGTKQADGSVLATRVDTEKKKNEDGGKK